MWGIRQQKTRVGFLADERLPFWNTFGIGTLQQRELFMSQAFVREGDEQSLSDIPPTLQALIRLLTYENGGIRVYEKARRVLPDGREGIHMSNGLTYTHGTDGRWEVASS